MNKLLSAIWPLKKVSKTIILLVLLALSSTGLLNTIIDATPVRHLDSKGEEYVNQTLKRAFVSFATIRLMNGVISVIQDTTIDLTPMGIGTSVAIGEALDPINDMVERASYVMLLSTVSLSIQKIILEVSPVLSIKILFSISLLFFFVHIWFKNYFKYDFFKVGLKIMLLSVIVRFLIPCIGLVNDSLYENYLNNQYKESTENINSLKNDLNNISNITQNISDSKGGFFSRIKKTIKEAISKLTNELKQLIIKFKEIMSNFINLITIFIIQTVLIPLLVLWVISKMLKSVFSAEKISLINDKLKVVAGMKTVSNKKEDITPS